MKKDTKVLIIVFSIIALSVLVAFGFGYFLLAQKSEKMIQFKKEMEQKGKEWGSKHKLSDCVSFSLKQNIQCGEDLSCQIGTQYFFSECLKHGEKEKEFCKGVPEEGPSTLLDTVNWRVKKCEKSNHPDNQSCQRLMKGIQDFCFPPRS